MKLDVEQNRRFHCDGGEQRTMLIKRQAISEELFRIVALRATEL